MTKVFITSIFCMLSLAGICQERQTIGFFRSIPLGKYGSTNFGDGGYAEAGWGVLLENNSRLEVFPKGLTLGTRFSYQKNSMNTEAMEKEFTTQLGYATKIGSAAYQPIMVLIGPHYTIPLSKQLNLDLKSGLGVMFTNVNSFKIDVSDDQGHVVYSDVLDLSSNTAFTYLLGLQLRGTVSKNISIGLFADFSSAKEKMEARLGNLSTGGSSFNIASLNTGISFRFQY